ncbi:MAG: transglycosylase domain-containing protein [Peptococcaceae bacterium]|nr:transglycosylase domain-containing protein [Peptococcaceae bacterium]
MKKFFKKLKGAGSMKRVILRCTLLGLGTLFLLSFLSLGIFVWAAVASTPEWNPGMLSQHLYPSLVYDKDGNEIAQLSMSPHSRFPFQYEDLPELLIHTIVAVEDETFYKHKGFDLARVLKQGMGNLANPAQPGGSSLTVQLARNTVIEPGERTRGGLSGLRRKIQEMNLARQIERLHTKEEILTAYMTQVYFGHGAYGVRSAAWVYFGKDLDQLTVPDIALLCGLPQAPGAYDPYFHSETAQQRRNTVLSIMLDNDLISGTEYEQYQDEPFTYVEEIVADEVILDPGLNTPIKYPYFVDYVVACLVNPAMYNLTYEQVYNGGLRIHTTIDAKIQQAAEDAMKNPDHFPPDSQDGIRPQGAIVMLDNAAGDVVCMVGGREYAAPMGFNRATNAKRQPGSAVMPIIVCAPALETGRFDANTVLVDEPITVGVWSPQNSGGGFRGPITMRTAVAVSINIYAVKLYMAAGPEHCWNFAKNMGLEMVNTNYENYANALGSFEATPLEMVTAYAAFPSGGLLKEPRCVTKITDVNGLAILEPPAQNRQVMQNMTAHAVDELLRGVVCNGTGTRAAIGDWYICGKTGNVVIDTDTYGGAFANSDAWFIGYSPLYTAAVWMGFDITDRNHFLLAEHGGTHPVTIWNKVMTAALEGHSVQTQPNW